MGLNALIMRLAAAQSQGSGQDSGNHESMGHQTTGQGSSAAGSSHSSSSSSPPSSSASHYTPEMLAMFAKRLRLNHEVMYAFIAAISSLALIFIIFHWVRLLATRSKSRKSSTLVALPRFFRRAFTFKMPYLPSLGHGIFILCYAAINLALTFTHMDNSVIALVANLASRTGWMAILNLFLVVLLALKNTPFSLFTAWSYEQLNILHQVAGYTTLSFIFIHIGCYSSYFVNDGRSWRLLYTDEIYGMVAAGAFTSLGLAAIVVRHWWYELFYYLHVGFWIVAIVMIGMHQPEFTKAIIFIVIVSGSMWALDRLLRATRLALYSVNNTATLTPLPNGATRVRLSKAPIGADSGKHCFLWIPAVRSFETHPFTIAAMDPLEFVVASYDGFTRDLHKYAVEHPGVPLKASVEGSYGTFPDAAAYDKVVLIAGGSGASFAFGVALSLLRRLQGGAAPQVEFIWVIKQKSYLEWCASHLRTLQRDARVSLRIFVTRSSGPEPEEVGKDGSLTVYCESADVPPTSEDKEILATVHSPMSDASNDLEKVLPSDSDAVSPVDTPELRSRDFVAQSAMQIKYERPDVGLLIRASVSEAQPDQRVLVMGCGPLGMMTTVRNAAASCIKADGPAVEVHCESFGW
ncbi:ferric reductase NAD binding domain-containing protein [Stachybotrys elegans]|uniref:Ferric reductase NAD binding domain-containing protein n=1 Tax=Stachybotrys elegans TaxID=80388 RepID=A0A8K0WV54_9HYPO|nr:ferric reductase NAD binding domain-containing protein [Stachybotrys elegans]